MDPHLSLTMFLTFTAKVSTSAKMTYVTQLKNSEYSPAKDYYKDLRTHIKNVLKSGQSIDRFADIVETVRTEKQANYSRCIQKFIKFYNSYDSVEYFDTGSANWTIPNTISISSSPEFGLILNGQKYLIKAYYKKPNVTTKVTKRNIESMLTLMESANYSFSTNDCKIAVLNLQNGKLIPGSPVSENKILQLKIDAQTLANIWNAV